MWTREAAHVLRWEGIGALVPGYHAPTSPWSTAIP